MDDYIVRLVDMPMSINGLTVLDENGFYNIYINARICQAARLSTFKHEMQHINKGHFYSALSACMLESEIK